MDHIRFDEVPAADDSGLLVGLVSDTHRLLREQACRALAGVDVILHAGDVGAAEVIEALAQIAPTYAIRGNIDVAPWADALPKSASIRLGALDLFMLHNVKELDFDPGLAGYAVVVSGHSHKPLMERRDGVLFINPGSIGPRRFKLPVTMARLRVRDAALETDWIELEIPGQQSCPA
jgi:uncharacterized protein